MERGLRNQLGVGWGAYRSEESMQTRRHMSPPCSPSWAGSQAYGASPWRNAWAPWLLAEKMDKRHCVQCLSAPWALMGRRPLVYRN